MITIRKYPAVEIIKRQAELLQLALDLYDAERYESSVKALKAVNEIDELLKEEETVEIRSNL